MHEVSLASLRAMRDFTRGDILWQALWPPLVSLLGWVAVAWLTWAPLSGWLLGHLPQWPWLVYSQLQTSVMTRSLGTPRLMARNDSWTMPCSA